MIRIPTEAFKEDDEEMTPEVGDEVNLSGCAGIVKSVDEKTVDLDLKTINGMPVEYISHRSQKPGRKSMADMEEMAKSEDEENGYA